jgi:putative endonuclease
MERRAQGAAEARGPQKSGLGDRLRRLLRDLDTLLGRRLALLAARWRAWNSPAQKRHRAILRRARKPQTPFSRIVLGAPMDRKELGLYGERAAAAWLRQRGMRVLRSNHKAPRGGEVDLICRDGRELVFVEVKTRASGGRGRPADAVTADKQRLIQRGAIDWLRRLDSASGIPFRFDIVEITLTEREMPAINLVRDAFQLPEGAMTGR